MEPSAYHRLRVAAVVEETADARSLVFAVPPQLAAACAYRPGQFLTLRLPIGGRHVLRCYSMSSTPGLDAAPRVTIKRVTEGRGSNWLCDQVSVGDELQVLPPAGVFSPQSLAGDFVLMAGGSGITPVFSILRAALTQGQGRVLLVYANRDERSVIFRDALRELAAAHPRRLQVIHWLDSVQGVPAAAQLAELSAGRAAAQAFICGPGPFMDAAAAGLAAAGLAADAIHIERFVSLPDEEDAAETRVADLEREAAAGLVLPASTRISLRLAGVTHEIEGRAGETVFEAGQRAGLSLPHSCLAGLCASCMCRVVEGEVYLRHNEALDERDLARRWTLACQSVPLTERLGIQFPE